MNQNLDTVKPGETVTLIYRGFVEETPKRIVSRSENRINLEDGTHLARFGGEWRVSWPCWYTLPAPATVTR